MSIQFSELAAHVAADGQVSDAEIANLRRLGWSNGKITRDEAEAIFELNRQLAERSPEWVDFFVEMTSSDRS